MRPPEYVDDVIQPLQSWRGRQKSVSVLLRDRIGCLLPLQNCLHQEPWARDEATQVFGGSEGRP